MIALINNALPGKALINIIIIIDYVYHALQV